MYRDQSSRQKWPESQNAANSAILEGTVGRYAMFALAPGGELSADFLIMSG
jgi:hypothetical protein